MCIFGKSRLLGINICAVMQNLIPIVCLILSAGVSQEDKLAASTAEPSPQVFSLVDHLSASEIRRPFRSIQFKEADEVYLTSGWYPVQKQPNSESHFAWTMAHNAIVDVPILFKEDFLLKLDVSPPPKRPILPDQYLSVYWNKHFVGNFHLEWRRQTLKMKIPTAMQRLGLNQLELVPSYWIKRNALAISYSNRQEGVRCWIIEIESERPESTSAPSLARVQGSSILQAPDSVITYYVHVPEDAHLSLDGVFQMLTDSLPSTLSGHVAVVLLSEDGQEDVVFLRSLDALVDNPKFEVSADLRPYQGQMLGLSLILAGRSIQPLESPLHEIFELEWRSATLQGRAKPPHKNTKPALDCNVLFILFDTLRADYTAPYHPASASTPNLDRLAQQGTTFLKARANTSWTRTSVTSALSGLSPQVHGVHGYDDPLPEGIPYLPEILAQRGYRTIGIFNNANVTEQSGFSRGFDHVQEIFRKEERKKIKQRRDPRKRAAFTWMEYIEPHIPQNGDGRFFVYLHEIDPHGAYIPEPPYDEMYAHEYRPNRSTLSVRSELLSHGIMEWDKSNIRYFQEQYKGEISYMDAYLGWILDHLSNLGLKENTLVVFFSDHGEEFLEHGGIYHGSTLYEEMLRVPLIFSLPGTLPSGQRVTSPVSLESLTPTILDLLRLETPYTFSSESFLPLLIGANGDLQQKPHFASLSLHPPATENAVIFGKWKLIERLTREEHRVNLLFDLSSDPEEQYNLFSNEPVVAKALKQMLTVNQQQSALMSSNGENEKVSDPLDSETLEELKALGYLQ